MGGSLNGRTLENPTAIPRPSSVSGGREVLLAPGAAFRAQQPGSYVGGAGERSEPEGVGPAQSAGPTPRPPRGLYRRISIVEGG